MKYKLETDLEKEWINTFKCEAISYVTAGDTVLIKDVPEIEAFEAGVHFCEQNLSKIPKIRNLLQAAEQIDKYFKGTDEFEAGLLVDLMDALEDFK